MNISEKLQTIAENEQRVYDAGRKAEYSAFWDEYQDYGNRGNYQFAFGGIGWNAKTLKPKYHITPSSAALMFRSLQLGVNLTDFFKAQGINLDFSKTQTFAEMLLNSTITGLGTVDTRSAKTIGSAFSAATKLQEIRLLILKEDGTQDFASAFSNCTSLVNLTVQGIIGKNNFNVQWSKMLSKDSITSIINALSITTSGLTVTLSLAAVNTAFETSAGIADGSSSPDWIALVATKENWTIALA